MVPHPASSAVLILEFSLKTACQRRAVFRLQSREFVPFGHELSALKLILRIAAVLILEPSPKTARQRRAVFGLQQREFAPVERELSLLKLILRITTTS